jgi:hypothetical protein
MNKPPSDLKFCKDCKHLGVVGVGLSAQRICEAGFGDDTYHNIDLVTGKKYSDVYGLNKERRNPYTCRRLHGKCGPEAIYFEPSLFKRFKLLFTSTK